MDDDIPEIEFEYNFTIIFKGKEEIEGKLLEPIEEIKTSKDEFFRKLRYFKKKLREFDTTNEIFIHEDCSVEIFSLFIDSIRTNKIHLTEKNYMPLSKLSLKYEYYELQRKIELFSQKRPDIENIIDNYSYDDIDSFKEEILSKHLDICLQNENIINFPIPLLNRILNSPKRVLNDHHLLFQFIKKVIGKAANDNGNKNETNEDLQVLLSSLDLVQLSNDELEELFNNENFSCVFNCRNSKEQIKNFIEERKFNQNRMQDLETQMDNIQKNVLKSIEEMNNKLNGQNKIISDFNDQQNSLENQIEEMNNKLSGQNKIISDYKDKQNSLENQIEEMNNKLSGQSKVISDYKDKQNSLENEIESIKSKNSEMEAVILNNKREIEELKNYISRLENKLSRKIKGDIDIKVQSDQSIKGMIKLIEKNAKLDTKKSKYLLNQDSSKELGDDAYSDGCEIKSLNQEICFFKAAGTYFLHALIVDNYGSSKELVSQPVQTKGVVFTFNFTGNVQYCTLEPGFYKLEVWGAEGGKKSDWSNTAGKGGYSSGVLKLNKKTKLFIHVGESPTTNDGGWNGGGSSCNGYSVGGGGATDISLYGENGSNWNNGNHLYSRIIVAGGGGGSSHNDYKQLYGGFGGGMNGQSTGTLSGLEGTQTQAAQNNDYSKGQGFGIGGSHIYYCSSGGGGGWYGGASSNGTKGGYGITNSSGGFGGSGGSGYVYCQSTACNYPSGCMLDSSFYLTNASTIAGNSSFPNPSGSGNETGHCGNGYAKITPQ